ncbi:MAG: hypothetical protein AAFY65_03450 [Pseudomonadota bacterium]
MPHLPMPPRGVARPPWVKRAVLLSASAMFFAVALTGLSAAQETEPTPDVRAEEVYKIMTLRRMAAVLERLDPDVQRAGPAFQMTIEDVPVLVISDPRADRMRAMVPIRSAVGLTETDLTRMMQANFDSALDARYAVAEGRVWAVFIHPLSPLRDEQLISGIGQTVNAALTYGTLFSSGGVQFGRGDSAGEQQKLIERLQKRGQDI